MQKSGSDQIIETLRLTAAWSHMMVECYSTHNALHKQNQSHYLSKLTQRLLQTIILAMVRLI